MNPLTGKVVPVDGADGTRRRSIAQDVVRALAQVLGKIGLLRENADYHLPRAAMVIIFFFFGYQKWWPYEVERVIPFISNGPLIFWLYPAFGMRGATLFLGVSEWTFGTLLFLGFWNRKLGILGALGSCATFIGTVTIIPFIPGGWDAAAGGFPAMTGYVPFLMKDVVAARSLTLPAAAGRRARIGRGLYWRADAKLTQFGTSPDTILVPSSEIAHGQR